jgi:hypothetical protein
MTNAGISRPNLIQTKQKMGEKRLRKNNEKWSPGNLQKIRGFFDPKN